MSQSASDGFPPAPGSPARPPLRVLLVDDAALVREGIARLLEEHGFEVVGRSGDAGDLMQVVDALRPDVVVMDVRMPPTYTLEGLRAAIALRDRHAQLPVLVLSQYIETRYAVDLLGAGARGVGYLLKDRVTSIEWFIDALRRVAGGGTAIDQDVVAALVTRSRRHGGLDALSPRETEVLGLMAEGLSNPAITRRLGLSGRTVESHVASIFGKLGLLPTPDDERRVLAAIQYLRG